MGYHRMSLHRVAKITLEFERIAPPVPVRVKSLWCANFRALRSHSWGGSVLSPYIRLLLLVVQDALIRLIPYATQ